jgi:hypothetical protein
VCVIAGFGSTGLEVVEGYEKWKGERVWLSISKIGGQAISIRYARVERVWDLNSHVVGLYRRQIQQYSASKRVAVTRSAAAVGLGSSGAASSSSGSSNNQLTPEDIAFKVCPTTPLTSLQCLPVRWSSPLLPTTEPLDCAHQHGT